MYTEFTKMINEMIAWNFGVFTSRYTCGFHEYNRFYKNGVHCKIYMFIIRPSV